MATPPQWLVACTLVACALVQGGHSRELARREEQDLAEHYLTQYGYLQAASSTKTAALQSIDSAVRSFQAFAGLRQTGQLDEETVEMMEKPRCGVKDVLEEDDDSPR